MYHLAFLYEKYKGPLAADFKEKFPGLSDSLIVKFDNDPKGKDAAWADCVRLSGNGYYEEFSAYLGKFYGNCGVSSISGLQVGTHRNKGVGKWLLEWCEKMLTEMGFTIVIGTTNDTQTKMEKMLPLAGWEHIEACSFKNRRSARDIKFWRKMLPVNNVAVPGYQYRNGAVLV